MSQMSIPQIIKMFQDLQDQANQANEQRYGDILGLLEGQGTAAKRQIDTSTRNTLSQQRQNLASSGLFNTTMLNTIAGQRAKEADLAKTQIDEWSALQKAGVMERRSDVGPDPGFYTELLRILGRDQGFDPQRSYQFFR